MKNKKLLFLSLMFIFCLLAFSNVCMAKDLDAIRNYTITVDPRKDGSLDMTYHIEWEVLDSDSEGPLSWVKIGIPNSNIDGLSSPSSCVKNIKYHEDNGDYIRISFKDYYYKGDIVKFDFKFHQSYMYTLKNGNCEYSFTPGWFDDITVDKLTILWNAENVSSSTAKRTNSDNYLEWTTSLYKGRKYNIKVSYPSSIFNTSINKQASYATKASSTSFFNSNSASLIFFFVILVIIFISSAFSGSGYRYGRGYGYGYGYRRPYRSTYRSRPSCACVSSCACACACAGGGRAGCSKKDFYGVNLRTKQLNKILN